MSIKQLKTTSLNQFLKKNLLTNNNSKYNFSNLFSVVNKGENSYFNMSKTINFSNLQQLPKEYFQYYKIVEGDTWTNISYKFYRNIKLWWLICRFNNIKNPFTQLVINKVIKIPNQQLVNQIINLINNDR